MHLGVDGGGIHSMGFQLIFKQLETLSTHDRATPTTLPINISNKTSKNIHQLHRNIPNIKGNFPANKILYLCLSFLKDQSLDYPKSLWLLKDYLNYIWEVVCRLFCWGFYCNFGMVGWGIPQDFFEAFSLELFLGRFFLRAFY